MIYYDHRQAQPSAAATKRKMNMSIGDVVDGKIIVKVFDDGTYGTINEGTPYQGVYGIWDPKQPKFVPRNDFSWKNQSPTDREMAVIMQDFADDDFYPGHSHG